MSGHSTDPATFDPQQIACDSGNAAARVPAATALLRRKDGPNLAYQRVEPMGFGRNLPGVLFLGGFNSDMTGTKATALESFCRDRGQGFLRFDYSGHGRSAGDFREGSIGQWKDDALAILDLLTSGDQILVGSSMGGWIMLLLALARPDRVKALIGIAAAPDFTEKLIWATLTDDERERLTRDGHLAQPSEYSATPYVITRKLIEEARDHLLLGSSIAIDVPVRLLHGMADRDVPFQTSLELAHQLGSSDVEICLVKEGDHRLSRPADISKLLYILQQLT
jgi:pimeloyl-ACP methyl ester carboxylesterase